jgi:UDP-N-acetylmuramoyl-L-alanyl-D-glutamate--2,6-diaminopimelate ligase
LAKLTDILYGVSLVQICGDRDVEVGAIAFDSRRVVSGGLFVAVKGLTVDGHDFIEQAIQRGARIIVHEQDVKVIDELVTYVKTNNASEALGVIASNFHGRPSEHLKLIGVTGTNGKTTTVTLCHQLFLNLGYQAGLVSTVENKIGDEVIPSSYTTPDAIELNSLLAKMVAAGCTHAFMEVSSHSLVQNRVAGVHYSGGVFTNISHDHLDFHKTFDAYIAAKKILFDNLSSVSFALVNADDKRGQIMLQNCKAAQHNFALKTMADFKAKILTNTIQGLELDLDGTDVWFKLVGDFNAYNLLAVYSTALLLGEDRSEVLMQLSTLLPARGRFDLVDNKSDVLAIVDYAHTPDALNNVLSTITSLRTGNEQLITVVGCGGDRDATKRPKMARIAYDYSDKIILTSDNPRTEDPQKILEDMLEGIPETGSRKTLRILDRKEAIRTACSLAGSKDIILVAGKGHETYQEINGVRHHFDDKEVLDEILNIN